MTYVTVANGGWDAVRIGGIECLGRADHHKIKPERISVAGDVLTPDVPAETWNAWHSANIDHPLVKSGLVHAVEQRGTAPPVTASKPARRVTPKPDETAPGET